MKKAYLNIQVETSGPVPTVVCADLTNVFCASVPGEPNDRFWATVDQCEAETFVDACGELLERVKVASKKLPSFHALLELLHDHHWDPDHSDALGG